MNNTLEAETLAHLEGYTDQESNGTDRFRQLISQLSDRMDTSGSAPRAYTAALAAGSIDDILDAAIRVDDENRLVGIRNAVMTELRSRAAGAHANGRRTFTPSAIAPALSYLDGRLSNLLERVHQLGDTGVSTAEEAIETGRIEEWKASNELSAEYAEIRRVQRHVTLTLVTRDEAPETAALSMSGYFRDALDVEDVWHARRLMAANQRTVMPEDAEHAEWLGKLPQLRWRRPQSADFPTEDRYGYLRWIASNARPFVPTIAELVAAHARNLLILERPADAMRLREVTDALDSYRRETK